ncbi:hypothetical protein J3492_08995 [Psychrobacter sp. F1192]|uniref:DUF4935 domain-containing protein n=1 Tax=Psychrobacter coccoides TaxID=2818440 RepID=A0ABS3NPM6_9GAMM|nr:hypothetical protein [Psychrobacter coccoides]MBO1531349.1 hypothetical protein [Psychrobacter coccoides]
MSLQNNKIKRATIFKPNQNFENERKLDLNLICLNKKNGIETSLLLDTNILIKIETVVKNGNKWKNVKEQGLDKFVTLLQRSPPRSVCPSIGFALNEMPPQNAEFSQKCYEIFFAKHLPKFVDTPNSIKSNFSNTHIKKDYGFDDLDINRKTPIFLHYASFIYLNAVYRDSRYKTPFEKFKAYLDLVVENINLISAMDLEIAKYCFSMDQDGLIDYKKDIRGNFLKIGGKRGRLAKNIEDIKKIAFNATCDVHLVDAVNISDQVGLSDVKQDTWIVTTDEKLVDIFKYFHYIHEGNTVGRIAAITRNDHHNSEYWNKVDDLSSFYRIKREKMEFKPENFKNDNVDRIVNEALEYADEVLARLAC